MNIHQGLRLGIIAGALTTLYSCANVKAPTGGPKDVTPPQWMEQASIPRPDNNTNFRGTTLRLVFDERIQLKNFNKEVLITPHVPTSKLKPSVKKNVLTIELLEPLKDSTTYTINFGNSIQDITEKNPAENVVLAFSTGPEIDSLKISGRVYDNMTQAPKENIIVGLYADTDSLDIDAERPIYFTKTSASGSYKLEYLKHGTYRMYALEDGDNNYKYKGGEFIGVLENPLRLNKDTIGVDFNLFQNPQVKDLSFYGPKKDNNQLILDFTRPLTDYKVTPSMEEKLEEGGKKLRLYNAFPAEDSIQIQLSVTDSLQESLDTTLMLKFPADPKPTKISAVLPEDHLQFRDSISIKLEFSDLVTKRKSISLKDNLGNEFPQVNPFNPDHFHEITIKTNEKHGDSLWLKIPDGAFMSVYGDTVKGDSILFTTKKATDYGTLAGTVSTSKPHFFLQLLNSSGEIVKVTQEKEFRWQYLKGGEYRFRVLVDENGDGKYEEGNFETRTPPEPVIILKDKFQLIPNWEMDNVKISF